MIIKMKTIFRFQYMYTYFLAGPPSYTAVVSAVDVTTATAVACISSSIINNNKYESNRNTTVI